MAMELMVEVSEAGADRERLDTLTQSLRQELLELDVASVTRPSAGEAPPGSRGLELAAIGTLVVILKGSVELAQQVVSAVRAWRSRSTADGSRGSVRLTLNGQTLELSDATEAQQQQLVEQFLRSSLVAREA